MDSLLIVVIGIAFVLVCIIVFRWHALLPLLLATLVGCGSKIFPWMNDSAFWIITKMSGMTENETIRFFSYLLTVMGIAGLVAVMILSNIFPMI